MKRTAILAVLTLLFSATSASAQGPRAVRLQLAQGSELAFEGTSTLHGFTCKTSEIDAWFDVDPSYKTVDLTTVAKPLFNVEVVIPVATLKCGSGALEKNMLNALKADQYPEIRYELATYEVDPANATADGFTAKTVGKLTIAGQQRTIDMRIAAKRAENGVALANGERELLMTQFGIKPPKFMFGTLKVGDKIIVKFDLRATPSSVAEMTAAIRAAISEQ